jgi:hypothetical protein
MRPGPHDRERVVGSLRTALTGGVIGIDTFELRVGRALGTPSRRILRDLVADLPAPAWRRALDRLFPAADAPLCIAPPELAVGDTLVIGRDHDANLVLEDPAVSRRHLMLRREPRGWSVTDLRSTNGTYVNGWRIERADLKPGDELQVGDTRMRISG